ncbi:conserved hypothetical protein, secreted [Beggiatoa sp. PS]|nr:conserved hypothetical protein, secreted [Beggiatoa sp. PS]
MNNSLSLLHKTILASTLVAMLPCQAADDKPFDFEANVALTTDLVFRGLSYTNEEPALNGGFKIEHQSGLYAKTWASNVNLLEGDTVKPEDRANLVIGWYLGYNGDFSDVLSYDIQAARFTFPSAAKKLNYEYTEFTGSLTYSIQDTDLGVSYTFSPNFFLKSDKAHYYELNASHTFVNANDLEIGGRVGRQTVDDNETVGFDDYTTYGVWMSYPIGDFTSTLEYTNTDLDNADDLNADGRVFFTLSHSF